MTCDPEKAKSNDDSSLRLLVSGEDYEDCSCSMEIHPLAQRIYEVESPLAEAVGEMVMEHRYVTHTHTHNNNKDR